VRIVGVDLSLTATGIACECGTWVVKTPLRGPARLHAIASVVFEHAAETGRAVVVMEGYAFARPNQAHQLGELGGVVKTELWKGGIEAVSVPPKLLKKFATNSGNAAKDEMLAAAIRRFDFGGSENNEADAYLLRVMGMLHYDLLTGRWPAAYMREAVGKVSWPEMEVTV
jgi:crossover junction endodeoxyribonuclease RuvC